MIQVKLQVFQVKFLTFKVGLPLSAAKIPRMMTTKTKTTPSKICAKHLNIIINIILLIYQTEGLILLLILILIYFWTRSAAVMISRKIVLKGI